MKIPVPKPNPAPSPLDEIARRMLSMPPTPKVKAKPTQKADKKK